MADDKWFCTIDVPNVETAAYLAAILAPDLNEYVSCKENSISKIATAHFAGGKKGMSAAYAKILKGKVDVRKTLARRLQDAGAHWGQDAPWLEPQAPREINGEEVIYSAGGIIIGCKELVLEEMREMVKKCEGMA
ncbi:hypothetical protein LCGC14_1089020 [marine sediment metagenome]|uniref:Uncharacterized protein n=1 Tax=marine sediment metagenome TaxID=412755 RepID=A0A0F9QIX0_9ZZZZ